MTIHWKIVQKRAIERFHAGDQLEAARIASELVNDAPDFSGGWYVLSLVAERDGKIALATKSALKAVSLESNNPLHLLQLGRCYRLIGQTGKSIVVARKAEDLSTLNAQALDVLGTLFFRCGENEAAARCHKKAFRLAPDNTHIRYNYASSLQVMGSLKEAEQHYEAVIEASPSDFEAHHSLSNLRKCTLQSNHVKRLKCQLDIPPTEAQGRRHLLHYALAKELEDMAFYDESIKHLKQGAKDRRSSLDYSVQTDIELMEMIVREVNSSTISESQTGCASSEPIFIVGMPRSGTTLVEQILSAHSEVFAAGELHNFGHAAFLSTGYSTDTAMLDRRQIERLNQADMSALGRDYINSTRPRTGHTARFIDKLPLNSLYCGHIHMALPNAKIILLDRHPLDVCYANFKMSFKSGYEYSYDLEELGGYYLAWQNLMCHWRACLPEAQFHTVRYEDLVNAQEDESRKLLAFCGLPWEEACLEFYHNSKGVATASAAQVRKPIYTTSVAMWEHYETALSPLIQVLTEGGVDLSPR